MYAALGGPMPFTFSPRGNGDADGGQTPSSEGALEHRRKGGYRVFGQTVFTDRAHGGVLPRVFWRLRQCRC